MSDTDLDNGAIEQAIAVLSETFAPADTLDDTARRYTSAQIAQAICEIMGRMPSVELVYAMMSEYGYQYVVDETSATIRYVWLLKYKC